MKRLFALAALMLLATTAVKAGETYSVDIGGRTIRVDKPRNCDDISCVSISIPGVFESGPKRGKRPQIDREEDFDDEPVADNPKADRPVQDARKPPAAAREPSPSRPSAEPAIGAAKAPVAAPPATASRAPDPAPAAVRPAPTPAEAAVPAVKSAAPVIAAVPPAAPAQTQAATASDTSSPLGMWWTEQKEGRIRIEPCGDNLCGYSVKKSEENGERILINMSPAGDNKWKGRIHDPKTGSDYDSTIALKGSDRLRVQGCAMGGLFCGGQTWTRMN